MEQILVTILLVGLILMVTAWAVGEVFFPTWDREVFAFGFGLFLGSNFQLLILINL